MHAENEVGGEPLVLGTLVNATQKLPQRYPSPLRAGPLERGVRAFPYVSVLPTTSPQLLHPATVRQQPSILRLRGANSLRLLFLRRRLLLLRRCLVLLLAHEGDDGRPQRNPIGVAERRGFLDHR